jgi:hypothetical protein
MKKIYLSALLVAAAGMTTAQMNQKALNFGELVTEGPVVQHNAPNVVPEKALGINIWSNNFDNPTDWTIDNDGQGGGATGWSIDATNDSWFFPAPISSTSGGNYAELSNGTNTAPVLGVTYTLTLATPLDIPNIAANTPMTDQVTLEYEQYGALFNDEQLTQISTDGGASWTTIRDNRDHHEVLSLSGGSQYPDPELVSINLAPYITGAASNVSLRFQWTTAFPTQATNPNVWITYGWYIDDINLVTNPDNDIEAQTPYWGSVGLHYFQIPTTQIAPIDFSTIAFNNGLATQNNCVLNVDINGGAWTGTSAAANIASGASDSLGLTTQYTPAATVGSHAVIWNVTQDEVDDVPANNDIAGFTFDVTDYVYARDNGTESGSTFNQGFGYEVGTLYDIFNNQELGIIDVGVGSGSEIGSSFYAALYSIDPTTGDFVLEDQSDYYVIQNSDLGQIISVPLLSGGFQLLAGETYLIVAATDGDGGASDDFVTTTAGTSDPQTSFYYDATDLTWYYTTSTPIVRMNFMPAGIEENDFISNVSVHPNPVQNDLNVTYSLANNSDVVVTIVDLTGKVVSTQTMTSQADGTHTLNVNTTAFASGLYTVSIESSEAVVSRKFVKK